MKSSDFVLNGFLSKCSPDKREALERFLPSSQQKNLTELPFPEEITDESEPDDLLGKVHWSWFLPTLKSYPEHDQKLFLASLEPAIRQNLAQELKINASLPEVSPSGKAYLKQILFHSLVGPANDILPTRYLPPSPLNKLLLATKKELTQLIDFLALYDLASELRQIVETKILKKIYSFLSEEEKRQLKSAASHKESFAAPRLWLDRWDGEEASLRHLLHRRGLARLRVALSGQDPDLLWYICHQLDIGRGTSLFKLCEKEKGNDLSDTVTRQIEDWFANKKHKI